MFLVPDWSMVGRKGPEGGAFLMLFVVDFLESFQHAGWALSPPSLCPSTYFRDTEHHVPMLVHSLQSPQVKLETGPCPPRAERDQRERQTSPGWQVASWIRKGTDVGGLSWAAVQ